MRLCGHCGKEMELVARETNIDHKEQKIYVWRLYRCCKCRVYFPFTEYLGDVADELNNGGDDSNRESDITENNIEKRKPPLFAEFVCAVFWKIKQGLLAVGGVTLSPFTYVVDGLIEWGRDLLDEYRNRKNDVEG